MVNTELKNNSSMRALAEKCNSQAISFLPIVNMKIIITPAYKNVFNNISDIDNSLLDKKPISNKIGITAKS